MLIYLGIDLEQVYSETDLRLPLKKSSNGQKCFSYRGAKAWNDLPADTKQATSVNSFKKSI